MEKAMYEIVFGTPNGINYKEMKGKSWGTQERMQMP